MRYLSRLLAAGCLSVIAPATVADAGYDYYLSGNAEDAKRRTYGGLLLAGGGRDVDAAFRWLVGKAQGGDVVVLRTSGADSYNAYLTGLGGADSVETIVLRTPQAAHDRSIAEKIRRAEALFIAGGDQWNYIRLWKGTPIQGAIHHLIWRGVPVGGASAGLSVLGEHYFSAQNDTITSKDALANPFDPRVTIGSEFLRLPQLRGIITDGHLFRRDRMGRLLTFMARIRQKTHQRVRGIGVDEATAVVIERDGSASVNGAGSAYFLELDNDPDVCVSGKPLTIRGIVAFRVPAGGRFNLRRWTSDAVSDYELSVQSGVVQSSTGSVY